MTGKEAYEEDVKRRPNYHDGARRKTWKQLGTVERWTWERNPTSRTLDPEIAPTFQASR